MRNCPVCGCNEKKVLLNVKFDFGDNFPLPNENDVVYCEGCGFVFADNNSKQDDYNLYYGKYNTYAESDGTKYADNRLLYAEYYYDILENYVDNSLSVIDVGCGDGGLLEVLKREGFKDVCGLDPSSESIKKLEEKGIKGILGNIFSLDDCPRNLFDLVISTGVVEHIFDLDEYLNNISTLMKPNGVFFVVVPAVEGFELKYTNLPNYFNHEHINYFSQVSLDNLMKKHGFEEVSFASNRVLVEPKGEYIIFGLYKKTSNAELGIEKDIISVKSVNNYLNKYKDNKKEYENNLNSITGDFILWGTGSLALQFIANNSRIKDRIVYCVDNNKLRQGSYFSGKMVFSPKQLLSDEKYTILICSMNNSKEIIEQIKEMGLENEYLVISSI